MKKKMARSAPSITDQDARHAGRHLHLPSALQEGRKSENIHGGSAVIWGISVSTNSLVADRSRGRGVINPIRIAILTVSILTLGASGSHASPVAVFCKAVDEAAIQNAGLQDNQSLPAIKMAAKAMQHLADIAPSDIKAASEEEASAYQEWAKTGNNAALTQNAFTVADDQLGTWLHFYCRGH